MSSIHGLLIAGDEIAPNGGNTDTRLSPSLAMQASRDILPDHEVQGEALTMLEASVSDTCPASDLVVPKSSQARVEFKGVEMPPWMAGGDPKDGEVHNDQSLPPHATNADVDNDQAFPPHYRNPNAFYQCRPHESPEDFKKRLLSETWEARRYLLGIGPAPPPHVGTSPNIASKAPVARKCKSCIEFNTYAPHLNDLSKCTCDGNGCTEDDPCYICEGLTTGRIAAGKDCHEQSLDHDHAKDCYNCARHVLSSSQTFHRATVGAARVLVVSDTVSLARDKYFPPNPCAICAPKAAKGIADCECCRGQNPNHEHSLYCFSCKRHVIVSSQKSSGATRVVVEPDTVSPESEKCIGGAACSICKRLMALGKVDCEKCPKRIYEHSHAKRCFNCLRRYFVVKSLPFHPSIVTAARIVGLPETPSGLAHTLVYPKPDDIASDRSGENGKLIWDLIAAGDVVLSCSSASTAGDEDEDGSAAPSPALVPADQECTAEVPCSMCNPLVAMGVADCKDCRRCDLDPVHTARCFNCLRQYHLQSQESHMAIVAAARTYGLARSPYGLDATPIHHMPEDFGPGRCSENNADLVEPGQVILDCSTAPTPRDTNVDSETEDDEAGEADANSSATTSLRSTSPEPEPMEIEALEEGAQPPSPRPTSPEPEFMEIVAQLIEGYEAGEADETSSAAASSRPTSPEPERMEMVVLEEVAQPPSPRRTSPGPEPMMTVALEEGAQPSPPRPASPEPESMEIVAIEEDPTPPSPEPQSMEMVALEEDAKSSSPRPISPETEPMGIVAHIEEDAEPPSPPATRGNKRKRRLSQCLSPTPEPRSSASPDPIPRTVKRHAHLPAFTYQPTRSPSPAPVHLDPYLLYPNNTLTTSTANLPAAVPFPHLPDIDFAVARRLRDNRAFLEGHEKRAFNVQRANLQIERECAYRRMKNLEREDEELRKGEVARLRKEIERLKSNDYY